MIIGGDIISEILKTQTKDTLVTDEMLVKFLDRMLYIRIAEEKIAEVYSEQEMRCPTHLSIGQEAPAVGVCENLTNDDYALSTHRCHAHYLAKGGDLKRFYAELYGKETGCCKGRGGSMHLVDLSVGFIASTPIVSGTVPLSVGAAFSIFLDNPDKKPDRVAVCFLGEGTTEEGVFHEAINFAKLKNLPILFACENNLYSVYTNLSPRQPKRKIIDYVKGHGLDCYECFGNDVALVYETVGKAIDKIKSGGGPAFIEMSTYRWREHCGPNYDDNLNYRNAEEVKLWKSRDPILLLSKKLIDSGVLTESDIEKMKEKHERVVEEALQFGKDSKFPDKSELNKYLYAD